MVEQLLQTVVVPEFGAHAGDLACSSMAIF
jgi:hypothetical protein